MRRTLISMLAIGLGAIVSPGASVLAHKSNAGMNISHSFIAEPELGKQTKASLNITHRYESGEITILLNPSEGVVFNSALESRHSVSGASDIEIDLSFTVETEGNNIVGVVAIWKGDRGKTRMRSYSIPLQMGTDLALQKLAVKRGFVELQAQETIR